MTQTILIDSNILVYAINQASPKHKQAQDFLQTNSARAVIAHQNIFESLRVLTHTKFAHPMQASDAISAIYAIADRMRIIAPEQSAHFIARELIAQHALDGNAIYDVYLAATALSVGITQIATDNTKDFEIFQALQVINPFVA